MSCGVDHRCGSDPMLLWLWCRTVAYSFDLTLSLGIPCAAGVALKRQKKKLSIIHGLRSQVVIENYKKAVFSDYVLFLSFFFFRPCPQHAEVPRLGIKPMHSSDLIHSSVYKARSLTC